jgi:hypothetical protein
MIRVGCQLETTRGEDLDIRLNGQYMFMMVVWFNNDGVLEKKSHIPLCYSLRAILGPHFILNTLSACRRQ